MGGLKNVKDYNEKKVLYSTSKDQNSKNQVIQKMKGLKKPN